MVNRDSGPSLGGVPRVWTEAGEVFLGVRAMPSAAKTALRGVYGDRLKVSLTAPPEDDRANRQLAEVLAGWLGLSRSRIRIETGHASRDKVVAFAGIEEAEVLRRLDTLRTRPDRPRR